MKGRSVAYFEFCDDVRLKFLNFYHNIGQFSGGGLYLKQVNNSIIE